MLPFNLYAIASQDVDAAESLAMCVPYALNLDTSLPTAALSMLKSLMLSWGSWDRLESSDTAKQSDQARLACMKVYCESTVSYIREMWGGKAMTEVSFHKMCDVLAGGRIIA